MADPQKVYRHGGIVLVVGRVWIALYTIFIVLTWYRVGPAFRVLDVVCWLLSVGSNVFLYRARRNLSRFQ
jgi:hypothetical protein